MKQKEVFKKIGGILQELNDQYAYLQTTEDDLNDLELELFASNAHFLTDHIEILCKLNLQKSPVKKPVEKQGTSSEKKYFEPVVQQMKQAAETSEAKAPVNAKPEKAEIFEDAIPAEDRPVPEIDLSSGTPKDTYSFIREEPETIRHELVLDESLLDDEDEEYLPEENIAEEEKIEDTKPVAETVTHPVEEEIKPPVKEKAPELKNELKSEEEPLSINQKMSAQLEEKENADHLKPITDIKLAITLNDKLLFVKDLFNGYNLAYSEAIEILNRFNTFEEATRFLNTNYVTKNNWEGKPATTGKFYALLRRRYA